jgi:Cu+-exporting ATPase
MAILTQTHCFHCGDVCITENITLDDKHFCCNGCVQVYSILTDSNLSNYYRLNPHPGDSKKIADKKFDYLNKI